VLYEELQRRDVCLPLYIEIPCLPLGIPRNHFDKEIIIIIK
jgi:hypothetical protein